MIMFKIGAVNRFRNNSKIVILWEFQAVHMLFIVFFKKKKHFIVFQVIFLYFPLKGEKLMMILVKLCAKRSDQVEKKKTKGYNKEKEHLNKEDRLPVIIKSFQCRKAWYLTEEIFDIAEFSRLSWERIKKVFSTSKIFVSFTFGMLLVIPMLLHSSRSMNKKKKIKINKHNLQLKKKIEVFLSIKGRIIRQFGHKNYSLTKSSKNCRIFGSWQFLKCCL